MITRVEVIDYSKPGEGGRVYVNMNCKAFIEEQHKVQEQEATIAELKSIIARQQKHFAQQDARIQALTSVLQKVNARLQMSGAAEKVVANGR